jgi:hypothetical protein
VNGDGTLVGPDLSAPIGINLRKNPSTSVGARAVERRGEGLYGRSLGDCVARRPSICLSTVSLTKRDVADAGDHKGPLHSSTPRSPLQIARPLPVSVASPYLRLMPITADYEF